jgi:hypothetical protein
MGVGSIYMACKVLVELERSCVNSFRLVHVESFRRRSLVPVRYTACAFIEIS